MNEHDIYIYEGHDIHVRIHIDRLIYDMHTYLYVFTVFTYIYNYIYIYTICIRMLFVLAMDNPSFKRNAEDIFFLNLGISHPNFPSATPFPWK